MNGLAAVIGSRGFIGEPVAACLEARGVAVRHVGAPRLATPIGTLDEVRDAVVRSRSAVAGLAADLNGVEIVVNAAGVADPASPADPNLFGGNSVLPGVVARACRSAGAKRLIHVSSAAVQGRAPVLDESIVTCPFSPYSKAKAWGEALAVDYAQDLEVVIYRPTSVHGVKRRMTRQLLRLARSHLSSVSGRGDQPTPQVLVENVADGIATVAVWHGGVPSVVLQPGEDWTCDSFLELLSGGRAVKHVPESLAGAVLRGGYLGASVMPALGGHVRRLEMLWKGQAQADAFLRSIAWKAPCGRDHWARLVSAVSAPGKAG